MCDVRLHPVSYRVNRATRKTLVTFHGKSWLFNRDPCNGFITQKKNLPLRYPPRNKALLRAYENHWFPLIRGWLITLSPIIMEVENGYIRLYLKGNYYWRDSFLTSMIMGESVATNKKKIWLLKLITQLPGCHWWSNSFCRSTWWGSGTPSIFRKSVTFTKYMGKEHSCTTELRPWFLATSEQRGDLKLVSFLFSYILTNQKKNTVYMPPGK